MEEKALYKPETNYELTENDILILVRAGVLPNGVEKDKEVVKLFARVCAEKNLSPFSRQIALIPRVDRKSGIVKYSFQVTIDGLRTLAQRTGQYAGSDDALYDDGKTLFEMLQAGKKRPTTATVVVYKILPNGNTFPIKATASWEQYYPGEGKSPLWDKMPFLMLAKCAEALALRKGFPDILSGLYSKEEMDQADAEIEVKDDSEPINVNAEVVETKIAKATKEDRQKLIDIASHPIFEQKSDGNITDREHILRIANKKDLTKLEVEKVYQKCVEKINSSQNTLETLQKKAFSLAKKLTELEIPKVFPELDAFSTEGDIYNQILEMNSEQLTELITKLETGNL